MRGSTVDGTSSCVNTRAFFKVTVARHIVTETHRALLPRNAALEDRPTDRRQKCKSVCLEVARAIRAIRVRVDERTSARRTINHSFTAVIHNHPSSSPSEVDDAPTHRSSHRNDDDARRRQKCNDTQRTCKNTRRVDVGARTRHHSSIHPSFSTLHFRHFTGETFNNGTQPPPHAMRTDADDRRRPTVTDATATGRRRTHIENVRVDVTGDVRRRRYRAWWWRG